MATWRNYDNIETIDEVHIAVSGYVIWQQIVSKQLGVLQGMLEMVRERESLHASDSMLQETYGNRPMDLVRVMKNCLSTEKRLVDTYIAGNVSN